MPAGVKATGSDAPQSASRLAPLVVEASLNGLFVYITATTVQLVSSRRSRSSLPVFVTGFVGNLGFAGCAGRVQCQSASVTA